jgi:hypothetical protein
LSLPCIANERGQELNLITSSPFEKGRGEKDLKGGITRKRLLCRINEEIRRVVISIMKNWVKNNWPIVVMIFWVALGVGLLSFYNSFGWDVLLGFATWILAVGVFLAVWQQTVTRKRDRVEFTINRLETLNTPDMKEALDIIYHKKPSTLADLPIKDKSKVVQALERMSTLGLLVSMGYADKELAVSAHRGKFIRCWYSIRRLICYERKINRGKYGEGIEYLAKQAMKYQIDNLANQDDWVKIDCIICEFDINETCEMLSTSVNKIKKKTK